MANSLSKVVMMSDYKISDEPTFPISDNVIAPERQVFLTLSSLEIGKVNQKLIMN